MKRERILRVLVSHFRLGGVTYIFGQERKAVKLRNNTFSLKTHIVLHILYSTLCRAHFAQSPSQITAQKTSLNFT